MKSIYDVIKKPLFTEKNIDLKERDNKVVIEVDVDANKHEIKEAVEEIFKVKVDKVATIRVKGKLRRFGRSIGRKPLKKKAIITLKKGEKLDFIEGV
ncbi:MAG: 50S ribosomal protein L23 [Thermodesulfovibrionales bacterium]|nr:50S ribosomal protein L23 [Thermodesulfovibrionales bacterium]